MKEMACIIMASGLGQRFGNNKIMAPFRGRPLLAWILDISQGLFKQRIVVTRHAAVAAYCKEHKVEVILHQEPLRSDTIRLGIEALSPDIQGCFFFPCDQPLLRRKTLETLLENVKAQPTLFHRLGYENVVGLPAYFPCSAFQELCHLPPGKGGSYLLKKYPEQVCITPAQDSYELYDIDTVKDLQFLSSLEQ